MKFVSPCAAREAAAVGEIRVGKEGTDTNVADLFTKMLHASKRRFLLECTFIKGSKIEANEGSEK